MDKLTRVRRIVAEILGLDLAAITAESGMDVTEGWDSLRNLTILMEVEQQFARPFTPEELAETHTVSDIVARLR